MSLRARVLQFINAARGNPVLATDPDELRALEKCAATGLEDGFVALTAPNAPFTWEVKTLLSATLDASNRVPFDFPWKTNVVGLYPAISIVRPLVGASPNPTLDDIEVMIDVNNQAHLTGGRGLTAGANTQGNNFVTLASVGTQLPRLVGWALAGESKPSLGFTFRWKQPPPGGVAIYQSVIVSVSIFADPRDTELSQNVGKGLVGT